MSINLISGEITAQQIERFEALSAELDALLANILVGLAPDDRRNFGMMGDRARIFAGHAQALVRSHRSLFPATLDTVEFDRDLALYDAAMRLQRRLTPLYEKLGDTALAAGYDAYQQALDVYAFAKVATPNAGVGELVKEMRQLFKRTRRAAPAAVTTA